MVGWWFEQACRVDGQDNGMEIEAKAAFAAREVISYSYLLFSAEFHFELSEKTCNAF